MDQIRKFGEQTSRILEFKPEGLEGYQVYLCDAAAVSAETKACCWNTWLL